MKRLIPAPARVKCSCAHSTPTAASPVTSLPRLNRSNSTTRSSSVVRLRFAPSPTGYLHLGGLRTALFNHLLTRKLGGKWVLRIEDTDKARYVEGAVESLIKTLKWAGLNYDEGPDRGGDHAPYYQSQRRHIYDRYLQPLIDSGRAYHCFCTPERLVAVRKTMQENGQYSTYDRFCLHQSREEVERRLREGEKSVIRFKSSSEGIIQHDLVYDSIEYPSLPIEDFVLRKSDGLPTYHFANVVDDHEMQISHVLRGEEWLPSTPKHLALYKALDLIPPLFAHMPLLINPDGSKLSKRAGDVKVEDYIARGYEPEALLNFVALMGWSPQGSETLGEGTSEVMSPQELIDQFSIEGINKNRARMSIDKLDFLNRSHIQLKVRPEQREQRNEMAKRLRVLLVDRFLLSDTLGIDYIGRVIAALKERIFTINDVPSIGSYFFLLPDLDTKVATTLFKTVDEATYRLALESTITVLDQLPLDSFEQDSYAPITEALDTLKLIDLRLQRKGLMNPLRHALTGEKVGAGVSATISTLGKRRTIERLKAALLRI